MVAGGTGAVGSVIATMLAGAGASVSIIGRTTGSQKKFAGGDRSRFRFYGADLTDESETMSVMKRIHEEYSRIDIVVNASGGYWGGKDIKDTTLAQWDSLMRMNLTAAFLITKEALSVMKGYGRIIHISAMTALEPQPGKAAYAISKSGVGLLAVLASKEEKDPGVTVNAIAPGIVKTPSNMSWGSPSEIENWVTPEQIGAQVLFLCSSEGGAINGSVIRMPGGIA